MYRTSVTTHLRLLALLLAALAGPARAETECKDCWSAQCPKLQGLMPKCKQPAAAKARPRPAPAATPPARAAGGREEACTRGRERTQDSAGRCCFKGQVWASGTCRGVPTSCPAGFRVSEQQEGCEPAPCAADRVRMADGVTCCFPGQVVAKGACRGRPTSCPDHFEVKGESCSDEAYQAALARPFPVRLESTPPGARVSLAGKECLAPCTLELPRGLATGEAVLEGFETQSLVLTVTGERGQALKVAMYREAASLSVESTPPGAAVLLDDVTLEGVTPLLTQASPGLHRIGLQKSGYLRAEVVTELKAGPNPVVRLALEPLVAPPLVTVPTAAPPGLPAAPPGAVPPAVAGEATRPREALLAELADLQGDPERKRELLAARPPTEDLTALLDAVEPPALRSELCAANVRRVRPVNASAQLVDSFGDEARGVLVVDGRDFGVLPFRGALPACATRFQAREVQGGATAEWKPPGGRLSATEANELAFRLEGRGLHVSLSGTAEYGAFLAPQPTALSGDLPDTTLGFGGRIDYWGKVFHATLAGKASTLFKLGLGGSATTTWAPAADLYVGFLVASNYKPARLWLAVDFGAWNLVCPSARVSLVLSVFDILFVTVHGDAHYVLPFLVKDSGGALATRTILQSILLSAGASIGVGW